VEQNKKIDEHATLIDEQNKNFAPPTLLTTVKSFTDDAYKTISAISDWTQYKKLIFIGYGSLGETGDGSNYTQNCVVEVTVGTHLNGKEIVIIPYMTEIGDKGSLEMKVKLQTNKKMSVWAYSSGTFSASSLEIYGV
jgi:hypothetical protein